MFASKPIQTELRAALAMEMSPFGCISSNDSTDFVLEADSHFSGPRRIILFVMCGVFVTPM
ncbi:hypothetical protein A2U01_0044407, partial [Trifolium medium]|nr:hypothetical protein [Trifolium medium]